MIKQLILLFSDLLGRRVHSPCGMKLRGVILEELGELPLQAMLLTFIETDVYRRVGQTE